MQEVTGKKTIVKFEVSSTDSETEKILQQLILNEINPLVNKEKNELRTLLDSQEKENTDSESPRHKYATENIEAPKLIPLGGQWAYSVSIVEDYKGEKAVRIAKGKIIGNFYRDKTTDQMILEPDNPKYPITQPNKINIKRSNEWKLLQGPVIQRLNAIEEK